jgi:hypothetical protein
VLARYGVYKDESDESIAKRLGVQVDVLQEARVLQRKYGARGTEAGNRIGAPRLGEEPARFPLFAEPPQIIYDEWIAQCRARGQSSTLMLRSVVHHVLRLRVQPYWLTSNRKSAWLYRGVCYGQRRKTRSRLSTHVTEPCYRAITARAVATRVSASAIVRWGITAFIEGKFRNFEIVTSIDSLYNDHERYCLTPQILPEKDHG